MYMPTVIIICDNKAICEGVIPAKDGSTKMRGGDELVPRHHTVRDVDMGKEGIGLYESGSREVVNKYSSVNRSSLLTAQNQETGELALFQKVQDKNPLH